MFQVTKLDAELTADGEVEAPRILTEEQLRAEYGQALKAGSISQKKLIDQWAKDFAASEALQAGFGVRVEKLDSREVFEGRLAEVKVAEETWNEAKKELVYALRSLLADVTEDEIAAGPVHRLSETSKAQLGIVEYHIAKSKVPIKTIIEKHSHEFPDAVVAELKKVQKKRAEEVAKRLGKA